MSKKKQTSKKSTAAMQKAVEVSQIADQLVKHVVGDSFKQGQHAARAELAAPILEDMAAIAANKVGDYGVRPPAVLTPATCRIILACLAEAGYAPKPQPAKVSAPLAACEVPGRDTADPLFNAFPVSKAA